MSGPTSNHGRPGVPSVPIAAALVLLALIQEPALAKMDVEDRGSILQAGRFAMRVTNIGVLGNAFFSVGRSFDPSFEAPKGSGNELLNAAELWVGARNDEGVERVSGGPMLEWRPSLALSDSVRVANAGDYGSRAGRDDDGDGQVDEESLNGRDDDGDARVDEDFAVPGQQLLASDYTDDQQTAVNYVYPTGESHVPLGLSVHQETHAWALPGHDYIAGVEFVITNRGRETLRDVWLGLYADLDARNRNSTTGHLDDLVEELPYAFAIHPRADTLAGNWVKNCVERIDGRAMILRDANPQSLLPRVALVPLSHTTDPLGYLVKDVFPGVQVARELARAPRRDTTFRFTVFAQDAPPGQGGPPRLDKHRYDALSGAYPSANTRDARDYAVLLSCGPFARLDPGGSLSFAVAFVALPSADSAARMALEAQLLYRGKRVDRQPNGRRGEYDLGETGINGHEVCLEPPPDLTFNYDPHCPEKFVLDPDLRPLAPLLPPTHADEVTYRSGHCIWTDLDCDLCTGDDGTDEIRHWDLDMRLPSQPVARVTPGDRQVLIEWDNTPETQIQAASVGTPGYTFSGYKLYRLDRWKRTSLLPSPEQWQRLAVYRPGAGGGGQPLESITNVTLTPDRWDDGGPHYPIGRYEVKDTLVLNGFDYHYVITSLLRQVPTDSLATPLEFESPFMVDFDERVTPHATAASRFGEVWVAPNPYRGSSPWERPPVPGDVFTRHIDFLGLPRAKSRIRIYTLAGDLVAELDHDGRTGNGQAAWNLISRNGQDVASGVYLFTVTSSVGHQVGRFVLLR